MQPHPFLLFSILTFLTIAQSIPFPSISINIPSIPNPPSFAAPPDLANGQSSSTSFSSSSSSSADGQGGSSISQISTTCNADAKCETHVNSIVNGTAVGVTSLAISTVKRTSTIASARGSSQRSEQTAGPVGNGGLLGGNADLAASGTAGSTVVVTGVPTETAKATKPEEASSVASGGLDGMGRIMILALVTVMGALVF